MTYRNQMRFACVAVLLAACGPDESSGPCKDSLLAGDLVVTEVFADYAAPTGGTGTDDGKEWFEIYNNADRPVSLKGVTIVHSRPDGSRAASHTMDDITIAPGQYFTLGNSTSDLVPPYVDYGYSADLGDFFNSDGGMLALKCGDTEIDSAQYELVRSGRSRQFSNLGPPDYTANDDLANWCEGKDSEFEANNFGTPGQDNDCAPVVAGACSDGGTMRPAIPPDVGDLVITELMPRPSSVSATVGQWFEVRALKDIDLNGIGLDRANDTAGATLVSSPNCLPLAAGQYAVFARSGESSMNGGLTTAGTFSFSINPTSNPDLQIVYGGTVIDAVTWTTSTNGRSLALDPDLTTSTANDDPANFCNGATIYNGTDYGTPGANNEQCATLPGPGQCLDNGTPRAIVKPAAGALVITEIMPNPVTETPVAMNQEWFEITNAGAAAFDLNGLGLDRGTDSRTPDVISLANCRPLAPGGFALFARNAMNNGGLPTPDATFGFTMVNGGNATTPAEVQVVDPTTCTGTPIVCTTIYDSLNYSTTNGWPATATADGVSAMLKPGMYTTTANDAFANFCPAKPGQQYNNTILNYGTPKAANVCM
jgi:hypothetical protein